jgi:hypothetical protein
MIDLAIATANVARDRVAEQFHSAPATDAPAPTAVAPVRRAAVRGLRAFADRLEAAPRFATQV